MNSLHFYRQNNNRNRNILSNTCTGYFTANVKEPEYKCINKNLHENNYLQRSYSADNVVIRSRGFKPSDIHDPAKRRFLENLTTKILHFDMDGGETKRIDLQKLLTPANDSDEWLHAKNKKMYASSYFYAPSHPTVEDQVELARRISHSLSDVQNLKSKGQSMYVNRKKRSVKWIHDGNGLESDEDPENSLPTHKDKIPLKCMMNPNGKVLDIHGIQALGEEVNIEERPSHPEKLFDIVRDLNNQKGRGAEIFAKRRKRSEKWVVEKDQSQLAGQPDPGSPWKTPYLAANPRNKQEAGVKENSTLPPLDPLPLLPPLSYTAKTTTNNSCKPFYNPFTLDLSLEPGSTPAAGNGNGHMRFSPDLGNYNSTGVGKVKDIQVRAEVGVDPNSIDFRHTAERGRKHAAVARAKDGAKKCKSNSGIKRKTMEHHAINDPRYTCNRGSYRNGSDHSTAHRGGPYKAEMTFAPGPNGHNRHSRNPYNQHNYDVNRSYGRNETDSDDDDDYNGYERCDNGMDNDYTPVPVKQLIKEFEKTCRPTMQYKQIDPSRIAPQLCTLDNEMISRYFEGRTYTAAVKHDEDFERVNDWNVNVRIPITEEQQLLSYNCNDDPVLDPRLNASRGRGVQRENNVPEDSRQRDWRLKYIDDEGSSTSDDTTETSESACTRSVSTFEEHEAYYQQREFIASQLGENGGGCVTQANGNANGTVNGTANGNVNGNGTANGNVNGNGTANGNGNGNGNGTAERPNQLPADSIDKSLVLAMVASEEDIMQTIKHLRRTPVLNNLIPSNGSSDMSRFSDIRPELGNTLYENSEYQGPKLNSYQKLSNYNTAPRGWDQGHTYYRPITFGRPQEATVYSDF